MDFVYPIRSDIHISSMKLDNRDVNHVYEMFSAANLQHAEYQIVWDKGQ